MAGPAYPEGDPRNAEYFENVAALKHIYEGSQAETAAGRANARTNAEYATGQIKKQEPEGFRGLRNRASKGGLTHSGIQGRRIGTLASQYAARRYGVTHGLSEQENRYTNAERQAKERLEGGEHDAATRALEQRKQWLLNNPEAAVEESMMANKPAATAAGPKPPTAPKAPSVPSVPTARVIGRQRKTGGVHGYARRVAARKMFASTGGVKAP